MEIKRHKTLFVLGNFLPQKNAGIENYTFWWISNLGINIYAEVLIVNRDKPIEDYYFEGLRVHSISGFDDFKKLDLQQYIFVHFMELSGISGINSKFFEFAKLYTKVYFTFHLPYLVCIKGDLRYHEKSNCTGNSILKCGKCILLSSEIQNSSKFNRLRLYFSNRAEMNQIITYSDRLFYYADWFYEFCLESSFNVNSFKKVPYLNALELNNNKKKHHKPQMRLVYVGRIERQKGLLLVCKALKMYSEVQLDVFGNIVDNEYYQLCCNETNFNYMGIVSRDSLMEKLPVYDALILPSMFSEMASMVLLQAILQEIPVIVSSALGNIELVKNYSKGLVFDYGSYESLNNCIRQFYKNYDHINIKINTIKQEESELTLANEYGLMILNNSI